MPGADCESVELARATRGSDLWTAIEAAQAGRVVIHDEPADAAEEDAILCFATALDRAVEAWEQAALQNKEPLLRLIDESLAALALKGLSPYWGCIERTITLDNGDDLAMPVAVIAIGRSSAPTCRIQMPLLLDAAAEDGGGGGGV